MAKKEKNADKLLEKTLEQHHVNDLTIQLMLLATIGTLVATILTFLLRGSGLPEIKPELMFVPWSIALVFAVPAGFRRGVMAERERAEKAGNSK